MELSTDRRTLLRQALMLAGAGVAASGCTTIALAAADAPARLTMAQMETLAAVADTLVPQTDTPGALATSVPALFDGLMANWASPDTRAAIGSVLDRIGATGLAALPAAERLVRLKAIDAAALAPAPGPQHNPFGPPPASDPAYQRLKELVLVLYYYSQPALTQELRYVHVPGRWTPSVPVTADTRPSGGPGMF